MSNASTVVTPEVSPPERVISSEMLYGTIISFADGEELCFIDNPRPTILPREWLQAGRERLGDDTKLDANDANLSEPH